MYKAQIDKKFFNFKYFAMKLEDKNMQRIRR